MEDDDGAIEMVKSLKDRVSVNRGSSVIYWNASGENFTKKSTPLEKRDGVQWYLIHISGNYIGVRPCSDIESSDYLLAEMDSETAFKITTKCKIEID